MAHSPVCAILDCGKKHYGRGWCQSHWYRWHRYGDPLGGGIIRGERERFYRDVVLAYDGTECLIWPYGRSKSGYVTMGGKIVSRLVCEEEHGPPPTPEHEAAHSCGKGDKGCLTRRHLSWKTSSENHADKLLHGTHNRGEQSPLVKLTEANVREIRALRGIVSQDKMAERFGVHPGTIQSIHDGRTWAWLQ